MTKTHEVKQLGVSLEPAINRHLPLINNTPSDPSIATAMSKAITISRNAGQITFPLTADMQLYQIDVSIIFNHTNRFKDVVSILGGMYFLECHISSIMNRASYWISSLDNWHLLDETSMKHTIWELNRRDKWPGGLYDKINKKLIHIGHKRKHISVDNHEIISQDLIYMYSVCLSATEICISKKYWHTS